MKNPNGYGSVVHLSGKRRRPYCVRKTAGWDDRGYPIYTVIGYYATRQEGMMALAEYNRNPYDVDAARITLKELYDKWYARESPKMPANTARAYKTTVRYMVPLYNTPYRDIKAYMMQEIIDNCGVGPSSQALIKSLFNALDNYALELDVIQKCYSQLIHAQTRDPKEKVPFSEEEIAAVWEHIDEPWMDTVAILLYTGLRINELLSLQTANVNLEERYFRGGSKTQSGKNRIIPIHSRIYSLIETRMESGCECLISCNGKPVSETTYRSAWKHLMELLAMKHTPHECRHTLRSRLDSAGANKVCIDLIMGHKSSETGERIYTHKTIQELRDAIELVT